MKKMHIIFLLVIVMFVCSCREYDMDLSDSTVSESPVVNQTQVVQQANTQKEKVGEFRLPMFSDDSPFNIPAGDYYVTDEKSEVMVDNLLKDMQNGSDAVLSVDKWSVTAYFADAETTKYDVLLTNNWGLGYDYICDVPIPDGAKADSMNDGHMAVIDVDGGYVYEFWRYDDERYSAVWGNRISLGSDGIYDFGMSSRGSGFCSLLGMIWPQEFEQGHIDHALVLSIPSTKSGGPVFPATESDGRTSKAGAIPIGARLILDPELDLDQYNLTEYERIICECLQKYGAFVGDTSGSIEFEAINPMSFETDVYNGMFLDEWILLKNIPFEHIEVLKMEQQNAKPMLEVVDESIFR